MRTLSPPPLREWYPVVKSRSTSTPTAGSARLTEATMKSRSTLMSASILWVTCKVNSDRPTRRS